MKILITGADGQLGQALKKRSQTKRNDQFIFTDIADLDITDARKAASFIDAVRPDVIIHAAALTDVDRCEKEPALCQFINVEGTRNILNAAIKVKASFILLSSDYVFAGDKPIGEGYETDEQRGPISAYGKSKAAAEKLVQAYEKGTVVRTAGLFSPFASNFFTKIIRAAREMKEIKVVSDQVSNITYADDLADFLLELCHKHFHGVLHAVNEGALSRYEAARFVIDRLNLPCKVIAIKKDTLPSGAIRPRNSALATKSILDAGLTPLRDHESAMLAMLEELKR